jgi:glycolate oxidase iron-sulfur subunit
MHLVDQARAHDRAHYRRPLLDRLMREFLARVLPYPRRLRARDAGGVAGAPLRAGAVADRAEAARRGASARAAAARRRRHEPGAHPARGPRRARVGVLGGCANEALMPQITQAAIRVLNRHGVEAVVTPDAGCCGSLEHHMGREAGAFAKARAMSTPGRARSKGRASTPFW